MAENPILKPRSQDTPVTPSRGRVMGQSQKSRDCSLGGLAPLSLSPQPESASAALRWTLLVVANTLVPPRPQPPDTVQRRLATHRNHRGQVVQITQLTPQWLHWSTKTWKPAPSLFLYQTMATHQLINLALSLSKPDSYPLYLLIYLSLLL